ncbi:hypothetical protein DQ04_08591020 [Trypanosoma grayi]|uniref:hypothetical protein n=1 Tax=Trypanosoma grayi TaxID=71804 RepID=UPI0004F3F4ED|nr:hypothetical protein DQ04_08591020 [Trypanosoma grayi]KEG07872.1 hypothetical protein DQ04_08591020 [Trypanosoma grayi]
MTERSLMIRCAMAGRYFAAGMDFPSARVFDVSTGTLAAVVEVPPRSRASLAVVSLTALTLGTITHDGDAVGGGEAGCACFAAVGLSNGTVLLHNVGKDELVQHLAVSDTQQPITAMAFCGRYLFCLTANRSLQVVDCVRGERVAANLRVQQDAGAIAVVEDITSSEVTPSAAARKKAAVAGCSSYRIFVAGPTNAVYTLRLTTTTSSSSSEAHNSAAVALERLVSFASQASRADFAWMGGTPQSPVVVTASAQEGVVRVWDARATVDGRTVASRCRRSLLCGQRIVNISVQEATSSSNKGEAFVVATTFTGSVLVWELGNALLTTVAEPLPTPPTFRLMSQENSARLLFGGLLEGDKTPSLLLLRGRFAVPRFEVIDVCDAAAKATGPTRTTTTVTTEEDVPVYAMPTGAKSGVSAMMENAVSVDMEVIDNAWATHSQQQQRQLLAARAMHTPSEGFVPPVAFHAKSVKELPQKTLTLEQRLKQLSIASAAKAPHQQQKQQQHQSHALGLATVPLYQALHANDASAVMELLTVASRSADDIRATVMGLQLPYCLQLLQLLAQRVRGANSRSPLFDWIDAILHYRGVEMYQAQQQFKQQQQDAATVNNNSGANAGSDAAKAMPSPPKDFVAPLLHQYSSITALYDPLAAMYGRLSIFKSVRPSERSVFVNTDTGVIFPTMFTEIRCAGGEYRTVRVRSKRDPRLQKNRKGNALALLRKARRIAAADEEDAKDVDDEDEDLEELDFDALDRMKLDDDMSGDDDDEEEDEEDEGSDADGRHAKRARGEKQTAVMLAESDRGSSYGVASSSHSSDADFDPGSDDDVHSAAADEEEEDEEDDDDDDDTTSSNSIVGDVQDGEGDEEGDDDDEGMGEDMAELLAAQGEEQQLEGRRHKRVKTDH